MTAYVHIGTPKTGTTTIQYFLTQNTRLLESKNIIYPLSIESLYQHWELVNLCFEIYQNIDSFHKIIEYSDVFRKLSLEILNHPNKSFLFSTEGLTWWVDDVKKIKILKGIFDNLGFNKVYIIVYLRNIYDFTLSMASQSVKENYTSPFDVFPWKYFKRHIFDYQFICKCYSEVFGKENMIVRLFDKNEFYQGDLLKDFVHAIGLEWNNDFTVPIKQNKSMDLLGMELFKRINKLSFEYSQINSFVQNYSEKYFDSKEILLQYKPSKKIIESYINYFEESNEWVRKEFFSHKKSLFPKKDLTKYKENYELKEMKPEYWDKIAEFIADIVKTKNQIIIDKTNIIQNKDKIIIEQTTQVKSLQTTIKDNETKLIQYQTSNNTFSNTIKEKDNIINSNINQINQLKNNIQEKSTQLNQIQSKLSFQTKYGTAKTRIQNQLSYKLGQAMITNSKSLLGYIRMPFVLSYIKDKHKQEQKIYQEKIKKDPSLKLPPLESYLDYKEALKEKECLTYKLGQALIQANKTWYGGGISSCCLKLGN
ncbi:hypothetical protein [Campylobacter armoricus]|uniref:Sulfotransferase domain-containing protein n=1 Tax=Campylobacter armoricus TaxID=2505970 RepID=A0A7L5I8X2_9BACT|nr:hypothetical protein [Campylobacter armoricus]QKF79243.1 hypothetical protein CARM_0288 [Campylobacter armoricus]